MTPNEIANRMVEIGTMLVQTGDPKAAQDVFTLAARVRELSQASNKEE